MNPQSKMKVLEALYAKAQTRAQLAQSSGLSYVTLVAATRKLRLNGYIQEKKVKQAFMYSLTQKGLSALGFRDFCKEE